MKKQMLKLIIILFSIPVLFFAASQLLCSANAAAPELHEIKDITITDFNEDSLNLSILLSAINKNDFEITIDNFFASII